MTMWFAVYEIRGSALISTGTSVASDGDLAAKGLAKLTTNFNPQAPDRQWNPATLSFDVVVPRFRSISRQEFMDRFTKTERDELFEAALNETDTTERKSVNGFVEYLQLSEGVLTDDQYIVDRVNDLTRLGILAAGRAAEILV